MKYYFNFIGVANQLSGTKNPSYRFPTDPQYKQDGVYNQRCKYRITNIQIANTTQTELVEINGKTMIIRFNNLTSMNVYTLTAFGDATSYKQLGERPVEFHIRIPDNKMEQTTKTGATTQTIATTLNIDPYQIDIPKASISDNASAGSVRAVDKNGTGADITGAINGTLTTAGGGSNSYLLNGIAENSFTEEIIGSSCWGSVPDISFLYYETNETEKNFKNETLLEDIGINFTLEVEPVAVKL